MPSRSDPDPERSFQARFHHRWNHLQDRHVRALAWLLCSPDLLDWRAPQWQGKIAHLAPEPEIADWLTALDRAPQSLHAYLELHPRTRLGRYAEKLMAFYFHQRGMLVAHSVQVQDDRHTTIGEFDFLLRDGTALAHWEFATKFYLLQTSAEHAPGYFMGPSLADMLNTKVRKILERQLALGRHPAAQSHLPQALAGAQALIKGWLFYHAGLVPEMPSAGLSMDHCRGFWCTLEETDELTEEQYVLLPRLDWLAPARVPLADCLDRSGLQQALMAYFRINSTPVLVAQLNPQCDAALETARGFVVPNDWQRRAHERIATLEHSD